MVTKRIFIAAALDFFVNQLTREERPDFLAVMGRQEDEVYATIVLLCKQAEADPGLVMLHVDVNDEM